jgi:RHS repeat-associated protein
VILSATASAADHQITPLHKISDRPAQIDVGDSVTSELLTDANSSVRGVVEVSSGAANPDVLDVYTDYDAYGNPLTASGGTLNSGGLTNEGESSDPDSKTTFGFGGGYEDSTGLVYLVNRYYDPTTGDFLSVDPDVGTTGTPYAYGDDNAVLNTDYLGLCGGGWIPGFVCGWTSDVVNWTEDSASAVKGAFVDAYEEVDDFSGAVAQWVNRKLDAVGDSLEAAVNGVRTWTVGALHQIEHVYDGAARWIAKNWETVLISVALLSAALVFTYATFGIGALAAADISTAYAAATETLSANEMFDAVAGATHFGMLLVTTASAASGAYALDVFYICAKLGRCTSANYLRMHKKWDSRK